jgi:hypothetical protein
LLSKRKKIKDHELEGFKYFKAISKLLESLHGAGCERDIAGGIKGVRYFSFDIAVHRRTAPSRLLRKISHAPERFLHFSPKNSTPPNFFGLFRETRRKSVKKGPNR